MHELIRIYNEDHRRDKFSKVISGYPYWEETLERTVNGLMYRTDYEFFLARLTLSKEIVGWIAVSFVSEGNETIGRHKFEAKMEQTEMYSNILETWKVASSGGKINVWEEIKRTSSSLQAKHMPPDHCIINALVYYKHEQFEDIDIAGELIKKVIAYWRNEVDIATEWAIWVQAPASAQLMYEENAFEEVGKYNIEIGDYGYPPKWDRNVSGKYGWKFMVRREPSGSAIHEPLAGPILDKGKRKQHDLDDLQAQNEYNWKSADRRLEDIWTGQGNPSLSGEVESLMRVQRNAEAKGYRPPPRSKGKNREDGGVIAGPAPRGRPPARPLQGNTTVTSQSKGKEKEKQEHVPGPAPRGEPPAPPLQGNTTVTSQIQDNFIPTKSEEDLIGAMREGHVDEEEIELVKALTFSLSDEVEGE